MLDGRSHDVAGGLPSLREDEIHLPSIMSVGNSRQVAPEDQGVDGLADRLLGDPHPTDNGLQRGVAPVHRAHDVTPGPRKILVPGLNQRAVGSVSVGLLRGTEERGKRDVIETVRARCAPRQASCVLTVNYMDYSACGSGCDPHDRGVTGEAYAACPDAEDESARAAPPFPRDARPSTPRGDAHSRARGAAGLRPQRTWPGAYH